MQLLRHPFLGILVLFCAFFSALAHTYSAIPSHGIHDPQQVFAQDFHQQLARLLQSAQEFSDVNIHLLVLNQPELPLMEAAQLQKAQWELQFPELLSKPKVIYLAINIATRESIMLLGPQSQQTESLMAGLRNIHYEIVKTNLESGAYHKACLEGVVALRTVLGDWHWVTQTAAPSASADPLTWLKRISGLIFLLALLWIGFGDKFRRSDARVGLNHEQAMVR